MPHIVLTDEQLRILAEAKGAVEVRNEQGKCVTFVQMLAPADVEAILRYRARKGSPSGPSIPSVRVQAMLRKAHEIADREEMTPEKMAELVRRSIAGEEL